MNKFKIGFLMASVFVASNAMATTFNDLNDQDEAVVKTTLINALSNGSDDGLIINNVKQINDSNVYMFKYGIDGNNTTMTYIKDINSVVVPNGGIFDLATKSFSNQAYEASFNKPLLDQIKQEDIIEYKAPNESKFVYVFTDPTCGYCKKLNREMPDYHKEGITIKYLPFPRGGLSGFAHDALVNTLCATDKKEALYQAEVKNVLPETKSGITAQELEMCKKDVAAAYELGKKLGVTGTPAIFTPDGHQIGGYLPAAQMKYTLDMLSKNK